MFLTNEGAVLALALLGMMLGMLFVSSLGEWLYTQIVRNNCAELRKKLAG